MKKKIILFLTTILVLAALPLLLFSQDAGMPDLGKYLQSHPELRGKIPATKTAAEAKRPATPTGETTAAVPEKGILTFPTLEVLIREKGILPPDELKVFGQQLFASGPTSFTPPANIPVTPDYVVGPDDAIVVSVWGRLNETYTLTVQRNGSVYIPQVGSIQVAGQTYKQVVASIRKEVESVLGVNASVTMGELRSITVFIVGAVKQPGAYTVSAFDTILNALIYAGGPEAKSLLDDWYRAKLKKENIDVRQLVERLKQEKDRIYYGREKDRIYGREKAQPGEAPVAMGAPPPPPDRIARPASNSTLMQLMTILQEERQSEEVIKRVRELDGEQLQKELENLETVEKSRDKYTSLRQLIEKIKTDKELAERKKDYGSLEVRQLEDELRKLDIYGDREERDYTLQQYVFSQERYNKGAEAEKDILLPVQLGSMRNIQLKRNDKLVSVFDLYDLILSGDKSKDLRLQQGDVIFVPKPEATVAIYGDVKVPALYELKRDQSLLTVLNLAGGLKTSAFGGQIQVQRYANNQERVVLDSSLDVLKARKDPFILQDGDRVNVFRVAEEDVNAVYVFGNVKRPGKYQFRPGMRVSDMITDRDLQPETDLSYAFVKRLKRPAMTPTIVPFNLSAAMQKAAAEDLPLQPYDELYVFRQWDFQSKPDITVSGEVRNPGKYPLQSNMRLKDALFMAGGPNANAYLGAAHIFRTDPQNRSITMLVLNISRALAEGEQDNVVMKDKDRLVVHNIQEYKPDKFVTLEGEIGHSGQYPLTEGMTVRDLIFAGGNVKESAYLDEAELTSMITDGGQNTKYENRNLDLKKVLAGDVGQNAPLRPYDRLFVKRIPDWRLDKFVTIGGEVRFPGVYAIRKGEKLSSLIERAGGYKETAYLRGTMFTRERVRELQQKSLLEMADRLERDLLAGASGVSTALSPEEIAGKKVELEQKQKFVDSLRKLKATGRMSIYMAHLRLLKGSEYDIELEDRDTLAIPQKNSVVNVVGSVMTQGSYIYADRMNYKDYIDQSGGYAGFADTDNIFVLKVDGSARKVARGFFNWSSSRNRWEIAGAGEEIKDIEPGDTIVVPEKVERIAWLRNVRDITQILMNTAVAAGVVMALHL